MNLWQRVSLGLTACRVGWLVNEKSDPKWEATIKDYDVRMFMLTMFRSRIYPPYLEPKVLKQPLNPQRCGVMAQLWEERPNLYFALALNSVMEPGVQKVGTAGTGQIIFGWTE